MRRLKGREPNGWAEYIQADHSERIKRENVNGEETGRLVNQKQPEVG